MLEHRHWGAGIPGFPGETDTKLFPMELIHLHVRAVLGFSGLPSKKASLEGQRDSCR